MKLSKSLYKSGNPVHIHFGVSKCKFITPFPHKLRNVLAVYYPNYFFTPSFKNGSWDGKYHFITEANYFPTGLLSVVFSTLKTGCNPLDKSKKVYFSPVEKVKIKVNPVDQKYYHPQILNYYMREEDIVSSIENSTFTIDTKTILNWKNLSNNSFQKQVQKLANSVRF